MKEIKKEYIEQLNKEYKSDVQANVMSNVLSKTAITESIHVRDREASTQSQFEIDIKTLPAAHQHATGRCWIFAATNVLREIIANKLNLEQFELSQNYLAFYDKYEKTNYLLESIIALVDKDYDDRTLSHILTIGVQDGGQWDMFVNLVEKYGVVPKSAFPETFQSDNSQGMNYIINTMARKFAATAQKLAKNGKIADIQTEKDELLDKIYKLLCTCYGTPLEKFDFEYVDKDKNYHLEEGYTAKSFTEKYIGSFLNNYVSIINAPTESKPFNKMYTVKWVGNVVGGNDISYLNLSIEEMKELVIKQLKNKEVVWFGSDCGKFGDRNTGVWDPLAYDYKNALGFDLNVNKGDMLNYKISAMNHAMVLTGVSFKGGQPTKFRVENSWGTEKADKGYFLATDKWFDSFVFQAVINKKYLNEKQKAMLNQSKIELEPWDPMGTLAD
ncbi:MAG: C1 family peptidase [Bacilli bacterium]